MTIDLLLVGAIVVGLAGCPMMMWLSRRRGGTDAMPCCLPHSRSSTSTIDDEASSGVSAATAVTLAD